MNKFLLFSACLAAGITAQAASTLDNYELYPAAGAVSELKSVEINFPDVEVDFWYVYVGQIKLSDGTNTYGVKRTPGTHGATSMIFSFINEDYEPVTITEPGTYTFTIPAGAIENQNWDTDEVIDSNESAIIATYTVTGAGDVDEGNPFETYEFFPAPGEVEELSVIEINFPKLVPDYLYTRFGRISLSDGTTTYKLGRTLASHGKTAWAFGIQDEDGEDTVITAPGTYTLTIGAGAFENQDYDTEEVLATNEAPITAVYTISGAGDVTDYVATPASGSIVDMPNDMLTVLFNFPNAVSASPDLYGVESNPEGGAQAAGIRATYGNEMIPRVADASASYGYSISNADANTLAFSFSKEIFKANKVLNISADKAAMTVNEGPSPAIEYSLTVGQAKEYTWEMTPAPGSELDEIGEFTLSFPNAQSAKLLETAYIICVGRIQLVLESVEEVQGADCPTFKLTFDSTDLDGTYTVQVEEGSFVLDGQFSSPAVRASYVLTRKTDIDMTVLPSPEGSKVGADEWGTYIAFTFAEYEAIGYTQYYGDAVTVEFDGEKLTRGTDYTIQLSNDLVNTRLLINIEGESPYVGKTGTLTVTIPEGLFTISGQPYEGIVKTWKVEKPREYEYTLTPAENETVADLSKITIRFADAETAELFNDNYANLRDTSYSYYQRCVGSEPFVDENGAGVVMTFNPAPTEKGEYVLSCDWGAFFIDEVSYSPGYDFHFFLDPTVGIESVTVNTADAVVHTLDGRRLKSAELKDLEKGLYIVNGKKSLVR